MENKDSAPVKEDNKSKISILFGEKFEATAEKSFVRGKIIFNKKNANLQSEKSTQNIDMPFGIAVSLPSKPDDYITLEKMVTSLLSTSFGKMFGENPYHNWGGYSRPGKSDYLVYYISPNEDKMYEYEDQVQKAYSLGAKDILENQTNTLEFNFSSTNTFKEIEEFISKGETFVSALFRSLKIEITLDIDQGLLHKLIEFLGKLNPIFLNSPISLLPYFENFDFDFHFRSTEELPQKIKEMFYKNMFEEDGFRLKQDSYEQEVFTKLKELFDKIAAGLLLYVKIEDVGTMFVETNLPGFENHLFKNIKFNK